MRASLVKPQQGMQEGPQQGIQQGAKRAHANTLGIQLEQRFGTLPEHTRQRIENAGDPELERWFPRVITAASLNEIFE